MPRQGPIIHIRSARLPDGTIVDIAPPSSQPARKPYPMAPRPTPLSKEDDPPFSDELLLELERLAKGHTAELPSSRGSVSSASSPLINTPSTTFSLRQSISTQPTSPGVHSPSVEWPERKYPTTSSAASSIAAVHGSGSENEKEMRRTVDLGGFGAWAEDNHRAKAAQKRLRRKEKVVIHQEKHRLEMFGERKCPCHAIPLVPDTEPLPNPEARVVQGNQSSHSALAIAFITVALCSSIMLSVLLYPGGVASSNGSIPIRGRAYTLTVLAFISSFSGVLMIHLRRSFSESLHLFVLIYLVASLFLPSCRI